MRSDPSKRHFELRGLSLSARTQRPLRSCILAILDGRSLRLVRRTRHRQTDLGQVDIAREHGERPDTAAEMVLRQVADADLPVVLRLPPDKGFVCTDRLPPASKDDLRAMVANRLDVLTPWSEEQAYFDVQPGARLADGRIEVRVTAVPRRTVDRAVEQLGRVGLAPLAVDLWTDDVYGEVRYDLRQRASFERPSRTVPALVAVSVVAALAAGGYLANRIHEGEGALTERRSLAAALDARLADVPDLHAEIAALRGEASYVFERKRARPSAIEIVEEVSAATPDGVWLSQLSVDGDEIVLRGYAPDASSMLALIEQSAMLSGAEFRSPSTRQRMIVGDDQVEVDAFAVAATIEPRTDPSLRPADAPDAGAQGSGDAGRRP